MMYGVRDEIREHGDHVSVMTLKFGQTLQLSLTNDTMIVSRTLTSAYDQ